MRTGSRTNSCDMKNVFTILTTTCLLFGVTQVRGSDLPDCGSGYRHNCFGTADSGTGHKYVGEFRDDKFNGQGTHTYPDGAKYVGEFKDGRNGPRTGAPYPESQGPPDNHGRYSSTSFYRLIRPSSARNTAFVYIQYQCLGTSWHPLCMSHPRCQKDVGLLRP